MVTLYHRGRLKYGEASARHLYRNYRYRAEKRSIAFELDYHTFIKLTQDNCYLCGAHPSQRIVSSGAYGLFIYNGIDRVDNNLGYVPGNVKACCKLCNQIKSNLSLKALKIHLQRMLKHENTNFWQSVSSKRGTKSTSE